MKRSEVTRLAIKKFLAEYGNDDDLRPFDRVKHLLGIVESSKKDLGSMIFVWGYSRALRT